MPYEAAKEKDGWYVYKAADGKRERKNKRAYKTRSEALPYLRALWSAERAEMLDEYEHLAETERDKFEKVRDEVYQRYHELVNMSASELEAWAQTEDSKKASVDRSPIERNLRLLKKNKDDWNARDVADANRTISFISRMMKVKSGEPVSGSKYSKRDISLRNWGRK
jgi:hypothetical protein